MKLWTSIGTGAALVTLAAGGAALRAQTAAPPPAQVASAPAAVVPNWRLDKLDVLPNWEVVRPVAAAVEPSVEPTPADCPLLCVSQ